MLHLKLHYWDCYLFLIFPLSLLSSAFEVFDLFIPEANVLFLKISPKEQEHGYFLTENQGLLKRHYYRNSEKADQSQGLHMHNNKKKKKKREKEGFKILFYLFFK